MSVLKSIISSVWRVQLRPSLTVLLGMGALVGLYEMTGRHTGVIAFLLLAGLAGGLAFICRAARGPRNDDRR
ncbi:hypothetical protein [Bosea sp. BIWAKO-01]|uniref:hypothetical protein n=1 Tax=Bosea sp. BIWAKO-01 TaxID=506668 RepID=UPI000869AE69|nr:hypothetical protein [Bosea sp. BIWAKO-01]GAU85733.1 hypothetical protein BIWAKO_05681 [Bosea sp. BIWAKO-01]